MSIEDRVLTKAQLLAALKEMAHSHYDPEVAHREAERLLLQYINDPRITVAFDALEKWYA